MSVPAPLDVMCVADLCVDVILRGNVRPRFGQVEQLIDDYTIELGGSAVIFASQFVKLGGSAGLVGALGQDLLGRFVADHLRELKLDTAHVRCDPGLKTGVGFTLTEPEDRAILTYSGSIDAAGPDDLSDQLLARCRHWHLASFYLLNRLRPHWASWLTRLRAAGVTTSLDPNWSPDGDWGAVLELLPLIDVLLPNEAEARAITGCRDVHAAGRELAARGPLVVVKRGAQGALAFQGEWLWEAPPSDTAAMPEQVVDTIGAGDCFDAGFLRGWRLGLPPQRCLALGMRCGVANLRAAGGFASQLCEAVA